MPAQHATTQGVPVATVQIHIPKILPELKQLLGEKAVESGLPLSDYLVWVLAKHVGRRDLATIPRKVMGRPRKQLA